MPDAPPRTPWVLPVLLAVATAAALGFAFLYVTRPNAGDLGAIRVVVSDDDGKAGNSFRVVVAEAPLVQKEVVSPGPAYTGVVHYPAPYRTRPNLKLTLGNRKYEVTAETELGFTWVALPLPDDFRDDAKKKDGNALEKILGLSIATAAARGELKPGLVFEDFTWEAKGLRAPPSSLPPQTFEQAGKFQTLFGQEAVVFFPVPYDTPPNVEIGGSSAGVLITTEVTAQSFKWRNVAKDSFRGDGEVSWKAKGVRGGGK